MITIIRRSVLASMRAQIEQLTADNHQRDHHIARLLAKMPPVEVQRWVNGQDVVINRDGVKVHEKDQLNQAILKQLRAEHSSVILDDCAVCKTCDDAPYPCPTMRTIGEDADGSWWS